MDHSQVQSLYFSGWKLHGITFWLLVALFVAQMDTSVTSTAILEITDQLGDYEKSPWVFTAYMLTFCGFQLVWAKLSDILTRKTAMLGSLLIFTIFSGACAASQTLTQLIMFRWAQGVGGCGIFALTQLMFFELVPPSKWPLYVGLFTVVVALSLVVGPLIGGFISVHHQWRWIFLLNVPICSIALLGISFTIPSKLPTEPAANNSTGFSKASLRRVDVLGSTLLLGACILISTGLQQAGLGYAWTSVFVLPLLLVVPIFIVAFFAWEWYVTRRKTPEPVFPWRFCQSRICLGMVLNSFFSGAVLMICLVQIPQRYMTVNGLSPLHAAVRLLAFGAFVPGGCMIAAALMGKPKVPPAVLILIGAAFQLIGAIFLSRLPTHSQLYSPQYGFQVLLGLGVGFVSAGLILLVPFAMEKRDLGVGTASMAQFRVLGGLIGIAIAASLSIPQLHRHLASLLSPDLALAVLQKTENMAFLTAVGREKAQAVFGESFSLQIKLVIGFAAAQIPATAFMWTGQVVNTGE
ncbi:MFS multidrug transporter-like protein [Melanomma pulvis-pyrius CBS 109.77]|uniref:MFS multidrug transporter-like protein n=1 Tax=Melanomma pulvis-pyrius CBS 109.77 TaxID=1314802 RepID=A0A6A6XGU1_9PLEO|nr:MFS multidrug transporter-like protein [Melanomma pulvis-pyrius CBS 109.77]